MKLLGILVLFLIFMMIFSAGRELAIKRPRDLNIILYFFSLAFVATGLFGLLAINIGAVDDSGKFNGRTGELIEFLLKFFLDVKTDILVATLVIGLVLLPQVLCYILSGIFGCASRLLFVDGSLKFFVWFVAKSMVVASGLGIAFVILAVSNEWPGANLVAGIALFGVGLSLLLSALVFLSFHLNSPGMISEVRSYAPPRLTKMLTRIHRFFTRNLVANGE